MSLYLDVIPRLPVLDLAATLQFYRDVLGFEVDSIWPEESPTFAILHREAVQLQFFVPEDNNPGLPGHATLSFSVADAQGLSVELENRVPVEWGPEVYWYGCREFAVRDPNGYLLIFSEETSDPPTCSES